MIYCGMHNASGATINWQEVPGSKRSISLDGNMMCGINAADDIYCSDNGNVLAPSWFQVQGKLRQLSVSNGRIYGVNAAGEMFYRENARNGNWINLNGKAIHIDHNRVTNEVCHVNSTNQVWCGRH